jgi:hypothetical protein
MVRTHPDPPNHGGLAQLGEHLLCKQGVVGSIPSSSTRESGESLSKSEDLDSGFYRAGCWIFNNQEEVKCWISGMRSNMGSDCILRSRLRTSGGSGNKRELCL